MILLSLLAAAWAGVVRHALVVGSNEGSGGLPPLRYAEEDAARMQQVLTELGGFPAGQVTILRGPTRQELLAQLQRHAAVAAAQPEDLFLFYYSGHATARGLQLGSEILTYDELRRGIRAMDSEVRLGVLDACRSGEITRLKGLTLAEPFAVDDALSAEGEAWLTAASAAEDAQESDQIRGSFFTHYLISGLRGAADQKENADGLVSLNEAYQYAYDRTVTYTGRTDAGAQHPGYDWRLQGEGDLAITDVREARARITLPASAAGVFTVLRLPEETPMVEVAKRPGVEAVVALPPGTYLLRLRDERGTGEVRIGLSEGSNHKVPPFQTRPTDPSARKGEEEVAFLEEPATPAEALEESVADLGERAGVWAQDAAGRLAHRGADWLDRRFQPRIAPIDDAGPIELPLPAVVAVEPESAAFAGTCAVAGSDCLGAGLPVSEGAVLLRFADGSPAASGALFGGKPEGEWTFFHASGKQHSQGGYSAGVPTGRWTWWYESGQPRLRGELRGGERSGTWWEWYENGQKRSRTEYSAGSAYGKRVEWHETGGRKAEGHLLGDKPVGKWTFWAPNGQRSAQGSYDEHGRTGQWTTWAANGQRTSKGRYWHDVRHGKWTFWWENGAISAEGDYQRGAKQGRWEEHHPNGQLSARGAYVDDLRHGRWRLWHDSGERAARGRFERGREVGRWVRWDETGDRDAARVDTGE